MNVALCLRRDGRRFSYVRIELVDFLRLQLLEAPIAEHRLDVDLEQIPVSFQRSFTNLFSTPPRRAGLDPPVDPVANRQLVWRDMLADVARPNQPAQLFPSVAESPMERLGQSLAVDTVPQPVNVFAAGVDAAVAM